MKLLLYLKLCLPTLARDRVLQEELFCDNGVAREVDADRIINGESSNKETWPFIVRFGKGGKYPTHLCGGTYIGNGWVLTSAHCFRDGPRDPIYDPKRIMTFFGDYHWSRGESEDQQESFKAKPLETFMHPVADLLLLKYDVKVLNKKIENGGGASYVRKACIPNQHIPQSAKFPCYIAGWGMQNSYSYYSVANDLQEAKLSLMDADYCVSKSGYTAGTGYYPTVPEGGSDTPL